MVQNSRYNSKTIDDQIPREPFSEEVEAIRLRPGEILARLDAKSIAYIPLGTVEWHGRHNPLGVDLFKADELCKAVARKLGGIVLPAVYGAADAHIQNEYGLHIGMDAFAGFPLVGSYYYVDVPVLVDYISSIVRNLLDRGTELVVLVCGHNPPVQRDMMNQVAYRFRKEERLSRVLSYMEFDGLEADSPFAQGDHAGYYETSYMMHLKPDLVNLAANDNCINQDLGVGSAEPVSNANASFGEACFTHHVAGLIQCIDHHYSQLMNQS